MLIQLAFVLSGACALAYEVLWGRWLAAVLGSSATAACVVLASYMGGQAAGAACFGWLSARLVRPLRAYVAVEVAIGASALLFPWLADLALGLPPVPRVSVAVAILVIPTVLLGGTVPLVLRWSEIVVLPAGATLGRLYGLNTIGAALGTVVTGFVLIPTLGLASTNALAVAGNFAIGAMVLPLALRSMPGQGVPIARPAALTLRSVSWPLVLAAFLSGCVALGLEVIFIRLLRITLSSTTYVFTLVIATFVLGIGLGGLLAARRPEGADVAVELARGQIILVALLLLDWFLAPYTQLFAATFRGGFEATLMESAATCALLLLPATVMMGFLFPLLGRLFMQRGERGQAIGVLYALNTLGAVVGAIGATFALIPLLGASAGYLLLTGLALVSFAIYLRLAGDRVGWHVRRGGVSAAVVLVGLVLVVPGWPPTYLGMSGGYLARQQQASGSTVIFFAEGRSSNVLVHRASYGASMYVDGKPVASTAPGDRANQLMLGHLPALLTRDPTRGLVVGMGTAMTLGALAEHGLERLDIVELERRVPEAARLFSSDNGAVLDRPELRIVFDDGYNFLHAEELEYDVITSDPIHPFVRGGSTLYSADYFARAAQRLRREGVFAHWLPLANMGRGDFEMILRSFTDVFPFARLYWNGAQDAVLVGRATPWNEPDVDPVAFARVARSLRTIYIESPEELSSLAFADRETLVRWAGDGPRSTIDLPLLEFSAPRAMHEWTLDANLMTLAAWRDRWAVDPASVSTRETTEAIRMLASLAPRQDARATRDFIARVGGCETARARCRPHVSTGTLRHVLLSEAQRLGRRELALLETGAEVPTYERVSLVRELLEFARELAGTRHPRELASAEHDLGRLGRLRVRSVVAP